MTYEHDDVDVPLEAVMVAVSPDAPDSEKVGVLSEVFLSEFDDPVSDPAASVGAPGAVGGVRSMVTLVPADDAPGPTVPEDAVTELSLSVGITVPSTQPDAVTVNVDEAPLEGETLNVHPAVPALKKSSAVTVVASAFPVNVSV